MIQSSPLTVTPLSQIKSVPVNRLLLQVEVCSNISFGNCQNYHCNRDVTVRDLRVSGEVRDDDDESYFFRKLAMAEVLESTDAKERIQNDRAFGIYDKNHDGFVTKNEILRFSGGHLTKEQVGLTHYSLH